MMPNYEDHCDDQDIRFQLNGKQVSNAAATVGASSDSAEAVSINFGKLLPMLEEAIKSRRTWISDFADEEIHVSSDLFDVIQAFRYFNDE